MSLRRGTTDGPLFAADETPRMRTSRISSKYQVATTVNSSSRRASTTNSSLSSRKPLLDRNALGKGRVVVAGGSITKPSSTTRRRTLSTRTTAATGQQQRNGTAKQKKQASYQDKENQANTRKPGRNKKSTTGLRTRPKVETSTAAATEITSSRTVTFTPATKPENRGSNLNSLRRSLRETITPPSQNKRLARTPTFASTSSADTAATPADVVPLQSPSLLPRSTKPQTFFTPAAAALHDHHDQFQVLHKSPNHSRNNSMLRLRATPSASDHPSQPPKTPKSILKDQLDMSMDESMLISPSADQTNTSLLHHLPSNFYTLPADHPPPSTATPSPTTTTTNKNNAGAFIMEQPSVVTNESGLTQAAPEKAFNKEEQEVTQQTLTKPTNGPPPPDSTNTNVDQRQQQVVTTSSMKGSIFSDRKRTGRRNVQSTKQSVGVATAAPAVASAKTEATNESNNKAATRAEQVVQPYQTPKIQNTNQAVTAQQQQAFAATPFSQRGNGVCMDLTSIFFNEPKTIRRGNKSVPFTKNISKEKVSKENVPGGTNDGGPERAVPSEEEWAEMQCQTFSKWLNFTLQPTEDIDHQQESGDGNNEDRPVSPSSSVALRTLILHQRMAKARGAGSSLFVSEEMKKIQTAIEGQVAKGKLAIRIDRDMYADLTQRKKIVSLLLSYSTPWLRLGLESLFNETILPEVPSQFSPMKRGSSNSSRNTPGHQLRLALRDFIVNRVLSDASVLAKYTKGKCKVPSGIFEERYHAEMRPLVLQRLLTLIFFLDRAKTANLLDRSPRLFTKSAPVKSSRDVLISFCRDFLASQGDITKHLGRVGLKVSYKQDPIDEIEVNITNFAIDLRDGIRLTKVSEILTGAPTKSLLRVLRIPAVSRLQKLHNVGVALGALRKSGVSISDDVASHYIVDGHRSMVLKLMWIIIAHYCFPAVLDFEKVEEEILDLRQRLVQQSKSSEASALCSQALVGSEEVSRVEDRGKDLLLRWCQAVCALFGTEIVDFSTSFADGKALCYLVHYYHPSMITRNEIRPTSRDMAENTSRRRLSLDQARYNEKTNSALAHMRLSELGGIPNMMPTSDTTMVPDEKSMMVYLCYACSRLLTSRREVQACLQIQSRYRAHRQRRIKARQEEAASFLLKVWRTKKTAYYQNQRNTYFGPVAKIEKFVLSRRDALRLMKAARVKKEYRYCATVLIQVQIRRVLAGRRVVVLRNQCKIAINMQRCFRQMHARRIFEALVQVSSATIRLQSLWRGYTSRKSLLVTMSSIVLVQAYARKQIIQRQFCAARRASICIQKVWRGFWRQLQYQIDLMDIVAVQSVVRRKIATRHRQVKLRAAIALQLGARCFVARSKLSRRSRAAQARLRGHNSAIVCQSLIRGFLAARKTSSRRLQFVASTLIQREWRAKQARLHVKRRNLAATILQTLHRSTTARRDFVAQLSSTRTIQVSWRKFARNLARERVVLVQAHVRMWLVRGDLTSRRRGALVLQRAVRCWLTQRLALEELQLRNNSAALIQSHLRAYIGNRKYQLQRSTAVSLQSWWRSMKQLVLYHATVAAVVQLEAFVRGHQARERMRQSRALEYTVNNLLQFGKTLNQENSTAAVLLQKQWCAYEKVKQFRQKQHLVTTLAAHFRGKVVRTQQSRLRQNATKIQSLVRRHLAKTGKNSSVLAVVQIQGCWRGHSAARKYQGEKQNATKIQAWTRGQISRCKGEQEQLFQAALAAMMKLSLDQSQSTSGASRCIQTQWRSYQRRNQFCQVKGRIVALQALVRLFLARRCRQRQNNVSRCAVIIQSSWRGFVDLDRYQNFLHGLVTFQGLFRQSVVRREFTSKKRAVLEMQRRSRSWLAKRRLSQLKQEREQTQEAGALAFQSLYLGYRVRKHIRRLHACASTIQRTWNGFLCLLEFRMDLFDIMTVQSVARRWLAKRKKTTREIAVVRMQSVGRMWLSIRVAKEELIRILDIRKIQKSAMRIQKLFRGHCSRARSTRERAAREIQKCWRCYTVHVEFLISLLGTMEIQAQVRGFLARCRYKIKVKAVVSLQAGFLGFTGRKVASTRRTAVNKLQAHMRMLVTRAAFYRQLDGVIDIQRCWRGALARNHEIIRFNAATQIQKIWRGYVDNFDYNIIVFSALQIQQVTRVYLAKRYRSFLEAERRRLLLPIAATTIQGAVREFLAKGAFRRMVRQVTSLQALVRGHRVRRKRGKRMRITASRLMQASLRATETPNMQLGARTIAALTVLQTSSRLAEIMTAICTLELSTRYSRPCCEAFAHAKATDILLSLIKQCNRSLPHVELLTYILLTLKNVAQYDCFLTHVASVRAAEIFLDLVQMFRDKDGIFCFSVYLLQRCIRYDDEIKTLCRSHENMKRLKGVHTLCTKKLSTSRGNGNRRSSVIGTRSRSGDSKRRASVLGGLGTPDLAEGASALRVVISLVSAD